jgi:hypothetical protein
MNQDKQKPYQTYHYQLTSNDMLAWRTLRNDWSTGEKIFGITLVIICSFILALLPEPWVGAPYDMRFLLLFGATIILTYAIFRLCIAYNDRRLSRCDIPAPRQMILEDWVDHLDERWEGGRRSLALEMIGKVVETPSHVFVQSHGPVIIVPAAAFASANEKYAFAANLEQQSKEAPSWSGT